MKSNSPITGGAIKGKGADESEDYRTKPERRRRPFDLVGEAGADDPGAGQ